MIRKSPKKFTEEFKKEAIKLVTEHGYSQKQAAESLGISSKNLNRWIHAEAKAKAKKDTMSTEEKENRALRKEINRLKLEKEILKKAAAFFARELD